MSQDRRERGLAARLARRPAVYGSVAAVGVVLVVVVLVWFQPQALLFDRVVEEGFPATEGATAPGTAVPEPGDATQDAEEAIPVATGSFTSRSRYTVTGTSSVYDLQDGARVLRLEDFESTNGPDLFVYLTAAGAAEADADLNQDFVNLGALKGNVGNQNYKIPAGVDLDTYNTVVIWCRRFTVGFGAADLSPVQ